MGGIDKAEMLVGGHPILARVLRVLTPHCDPIALVGRTSVPEGLTYPFALIPDAVSGQEGPLAGILAALRWAKDDHVMIVPCDAPFLPMDLVPRLLAAAKNVGVVMTATGQQDHPTVSLWRTDLAVSLSESFSCGTRSIRAFTRQVPTAMVSWHGAGYDPFLNINRPEDLALAERLA
jgi:molybdopterin-guanine dinucleotide biosynthesis protein A